MMDPPLQLDRRCLYCLERVGVVSGLHTRSINLGGILTAACEATLYPYPLRFIDPAEDCSSFSESRPVFGAVPQRWTYDSV